MLSSLLLSLMGSRVRFLGAIFTPPVSLVLPSVLHLALPFGLLLRGLADLPRCCKPRKETDKRPGEDTALLTYQEERAMYVARKQEMKRSVRQRCETWCMYISREPDQACVIQSARAYPSEGNHGGTFFHHQRFLVRRVG